LVSDLKRPKPKLVIKNLATNFFGAMLKKFLTKKKKKTSFPIEIHLISTLDHATKRKKILGNA
jgi:hypothetical protein